MRRTASILLRYELQLAWQQGSSSGMAVAFFVIAVVLFPLGIGPELSILSRVSAGVIWVAVLLSALLSLDRLFQADFEDGSLDQLALIPLPLELIVAVKALAHWIATCLPIIVASPVLAILMNMGGDGFGVMLLSLLIGTPALSFIGAIGAALTVAMRRGGVLVSILVVPLFIPTLIFGVSAIDAVLTQAVAGPNLLLLGAVTALAIALAPVAAASALRLAME
jgi:heme exporter protein B